MLQQREVKEVKGWKAATGFCVMGVICDFDENFLVAMEYSYL